MKPSEFETLMAVLIAALPGQWSRMFRGDDESVRKQESATTATYKRMLVDLDFVVASAAVERVLASAKFFPTPGEIREAAAALTVATAGGGGGGAWGQLRQYRSHRPASELERMDPILRRCIEDMGWIVWTTIFRGGRELKEWRVATGDNEAADRARFIELYDARAANARTEAQTASLPAAQRLRELQARASQQLGAGDAAKQVLRLVGGGSQ